MIQLNAGFLANVSTAMGPAFVDAILCRDNKATVNQTEFTALRGVKDVVRLGPVEAITVNELRLNKGTLPVEADTLFIDCTAKSLSSHPIKPVFPEGKINLQLVSMCQQAYSGWFS